MKKPINILLMLTCVSAIAFTSCKKKGCTDSNATNYNSEAKKDDGSCIDGPKTPVITTPFTAKVDGDEFFETTLSGTASSTFGSSIIEIKATKGDEYIKIKVPSNIVTGSHEFDDPFTSSLGGYYFDGSSIYGAAQGTGSLVIVSKTAPSNGNPGKISGTFSFTATPYGTSSGSGSYEITKGQFKVDYQ